ncbi:hypothetical protein VIGAN_08314100 [Vigna angularis var. angularis]|uniref:Uncharacterized protein n=1 Tax=Vigna angularis var. angularis TaxID=157739 RepID=A0A0S3STU5_PHAAN|nr:hypothetical protein VIGAN_08314100 [Vigna angularis var. angularis]
MVDGSFFVLFQQRSKIRILRTRRSKNIMKYKLGCFIHGLLSPNSFTINKSFRSYTPRHFVASTTHQSRKQSSVFTFSRINRFL